MRNLLLRFSASSAAVFIGGVLGYFLFLPLLEIPLSIVEWLLIPPMKVISPYLYNTPYFATGLMQFVVDVPNTVLIAILAVLAMRLLNRKRSVFYPVFLFPVFLYLMYWYDVWKLTMAAKKLGLPTAIHQLPTDARFPHNAVVILLTYGLFSILVVLFTRFLQKPDRRRKDMQSIPAENL